MGASAIRENNADDFVARHYGPKIVLIAVPTVVADPVVRFFRRKAAVMVAPVALPSVSR